MPLRLSKNRVLLDGIPLNESKSSNLASAATIDIWSVTGNLVPITGTATIGAFTAAPQAGTKRTLLCISTPTFTHGANFLLPGAADYTAIAGDRIEVMAITTTQFRLSVIKALGDTELLKVGDIYSDFIVSGIVVPPSANVTAITSAGVAYVNGVRVAPVATSKTYTINKDTYVDLSSAGTYTYVEAVNNGATPAITALNLRVAKVVTNGTAITAITPLAPVVGKQTPTRINPTTGQLERWDAGAYVGVGGGGTALTIGTGGRFSNIDDAIYERRNTAAYQHTLLTQFTGSLTLSGDSRLIIADSGTPLSALVHLVGATIGVRIGGAGPIIRGMITTSSKIQLPYPANAAITSQQIDVYRINTVGIILLPGTVLDLPNPTVSRIIPAFTTLTCPVKWGAVINHSSTTGGQLFIGDTTQNEIFFENLVLADSTHKINSAFFVKPPHTGNGCLTDVGFYRCKIITASQDFIYGSNPIGLHLIDNDIQGTYDIISPANYRHFEAINNRISVHSYGNYDDGLFDGGEPTGLVFAAGAAQFRENYTIRGNIFDITGHESAPSGTKAVGVEIRGALNSNAIMNISDNEFHINNVATSNTAAGVFVNAIASTNTPTIICRDNLFNVVNSGSGGAYTMLSAKASHVIQRAGNVVVAGTLGINTAAATES